MPNHRTDRRRFLQGSLGASLAAAGWTSLGAAQDQANRPSSADSGKPRHRNERLTIGAVGLRYQGSVIARIAEQYGDIVALCDVDRNVREQARASFGSTPEIYEDYRDLLARSDIDLVLIGTPDHWHAKMLIDSCRSGKDVYCEKPLTLTIDEGKLIREVVAQTGRVVQVGTWQRSDWRFRLAAEMVQQGRIGTLRRVTCVTDKNPTGGPFSPSAPPRALNWDLWQGQTPDVPYIEERCHYTFRWWYEYSGGKMTDWGAHHIDIAQWAIDSLPVAITGKARHPQIDNGYNVATDFQADIRYENGVELLVRDEGRQGILFEGELGNLFVNRGTLAGQSVDELARRPLPREQFQLYPDENLSRPERAGKLEAIINHMGNFIDCVQSRKQPLSDVESQHRSVSTCHLANISLRLGRPLRWDPHDERFPADAEANTWLAREQRPGYEVV